MKANEAGAGKAASAVQEIEGQFAQLAARVDELVDDNGELPADLARAIVLAQSAQEGESLAHQLASHDVDETRQDIEALGANERFLLEYRGRLQCLKARAEMHARSFVIIGASQLQSVRRRGLLLRAEGFREWVDRIGIEEAIAARIVFATPRRGNSPSLATGDPESSESRRALQILQRRLTPGRPAEDPNTTPQEERLNDHGDR